ncbi:MAG TPA: hypothetical protein VI140_07385 [Oxalicibacterium sp.]
MWAHSLKALFKAIAFVYVIPLALLWLIGVGLSSIRAMDQQWILDAYGMLVFLYLSLCAPVLGGYLAASYAPSRPILHGLLAVAIFMMLMIFKGRIQPLWLVPLSLVLSIIGARRFKIDGNGNEPQP